MKKPIPKPKFIDYMTDHISRQGLLLRAERAQFQRNNRGAIREHKARQKAGKGELE